MNWSAHQLIRSSSSVDDRQFCGMTVWVLTRHCRDRVMQSNAVDSKTSKTSKTWLKSAKRSALWARLKFTKIQRQVVRTLSGAQGQFVQQTVAQTLSESEFFWGRKRVSWSLMIFVQCLQMFTKCSIVLHWFAAMIDCSVTWYVLLRSDADSCYEVLDEILQKEQFW